MQRSVFKSPGIQTVMPPTPRNTTAHTRAFDVAAAVWGKVQTIIKNRISKADAKQLVEAVAEGRFLYIDTYCLLARH